MTPALRRRRDGLSPVVRVKRDPAIEAMAVDLQPKFGRRQKFLANKKIREFTNFLNSQKEVEKIERSRIRSLTKEKANLSEQKRKKISADNNLTNVEMVSTGGHSKPEIRKKTLVRRKILFDDDSEDNNVEREVIKAERKDVNVERKDVNVERKDVNVEREDMNIERDDVNVEKEDVNVERKDNKIEDETFEANREDWESDEEDWNKETDIDSIIKNLESSPKKERLLTQLRDFGEYSSNQSEQFQSTLYYSEDIEEVCSSDQNEQSLAVPFEFLEAENLDTFGDEEPEEDMVFNSTFSDEEKNSGDIMPDFQLKNLEMEKSSDDEKVAIVNSSFLDEDEHTGNIYSRLVWPDLNDREVLLNRFFEENEIVCPTFSFEDEANISFVDIHTTTESPDDVDRSFEKKILAMQSPAVSQSSDDLKVDPEFGKDTMLISGNKKNTISI
jgi:hypothetical protein